MTPLDLNMFGKKDEPDLVPVYILPLAATLAMLEKQKGSPLTKAECEKIRDDAPAIMVTVRQSLEIRRNYEYQDVEPENVWVDWHRLRCHMLGGYAPKIVLCIPMPPGVSEESIKQALGNEVEFEVRGPNAAVTEAFAVRGLTGIASHGSNVYVVSENYTQPTAFENCVKMIAVADKLLELGGLGVGVESSGKFHAAPRFRSIAADVAKAPKKRGYELVVPLIHSYVFWVVAAETEYYSCGMHLLGFPDIAMDKAVCERRFNGDIQAMADLFDTFSGYLVAQCPLGRFADGNTFSLSQDAPSFRAVWEPCTMYEEDELFFNPYGIWRLE